MKSTLIALALSAAFASPAFAAGTTLTFQQGIGGYSGTQDTVIRSAAPSANYGSESDISVDGDDGSPGLQPNHGLIRFDGLFGNGISQIGSGFTVVSATLTLNVFNPGSGFTVHDMLTDWAQGSATWNSFGGGVQADGVEASVASLFSIGANNGAENVANGVLVIDVTATLQGMAAGNLPGYGWALLPFTSGTNGIDFDTSEYSVTSLRPLLSVEIAPVPEPETYAMLLAGLGLIGFAARRRG
ncbi:DNRLRE domain-containing protein [Methyloversatilis sp. XJ19-13]|uniref:DNRLRE domain-containing protein n=1 Tax=Methyloversatilis sp. XJ19-13 TaxID=2963430 RepID=UPI00211BE304|nr:DNRLRE domain-containing protein [Methyloversatilis sp. XJ19-13]MCQ9374710.1 DNRLRE domain-containing protein [Methyloversatilis sp. XJ19-13]